MYILGTCFKKKLTFLYFHNSIRELINNEMLLKKKRVAAQIHFGLYNFHCNQQMYEISFDVLNTCDFYFCFGTKKISSNFISKWRFSDNILF